MRSFQRLDLVRQCSINNTSVTVLIVPLSFFFLFATTSFSSLSELTDFGDCLEMKNKEPWFLEAQGALTVEPVCCLQTYTVFKRRFGNHKHLSISGFFHLFFMIFMPSWNLASVPFYLSHDACKIASVWKGHFGWLSDSIGCTSCQTVESHLRKSKGLDWQTTERVDAKISSTSSNLFLEQVLFSNTSFFIRSF